MMKIEKPEFLAKPILIFVGKKWFGPLTIHGQKFLTISTLKKKYLYHIQKATLFCITLDEFVILKAIILNSKLFSRFYLVADKRPDLVSLQDNRCSSTLVQCAKK